MLKSIEIIKAENEDMLRQCLAIRKAVFTVEKNVPESTEMDEMDNINQRCEHFLIRYHEENAGTVRCLQESESVIRLQRFCFYPRFRRKGFGKSVMEYLEKYYCQKGIAAIVLDAKFDVCGFYEKCGYEKISGIFMEAGVPHIKMRKTGKMTRNSCPSAIRSSTSGGRTS